MGMAGLGSRGEGGSVRSVVFVSEAGRTTGWGASGFFLSAKLLGEATPAACHWRPTTVTLGLRPSALADRIDVRNMWACSGRRGDVGGWRRRRDVKWQVRSIGSRRVESADWMGMDPIQAQKSSGKSPAKQLAAIGFAGAAGTGMTSLGDGTCEQLK